jgi:hypothetical protein
MTDQMDDRPPTPIVRIERAKSFDGYVVFEGERIVAVALSKVDAETLLEKLRTDLEPPAET